MKSIATTAAPIATLAQLSTADPRGAEYGSYQFTYSMDAVTVRHTRDGYTLTLEGAENFAAWVSAVLGISVQEMHEKAEVLTYSAE